MQTSSVKDPATAARVAENPPAAGKPSDPAFAPLTGVPYLLPKGLLQIGVVVTKTADGKFESVDVKTETQLVPDESRLFLLGRGLDLLTRKDQKVTLTNGMLTSVTTKDEGQAGEVLKGAASIWLNVLKIREVQGTIKALDAIKPTEANSGLEALAHAPLASTRAADTRRAFPQVLAWPNVDRILGGIDGFYDGAARQAELRRHATREEQETLLSTGLPSAPPILWSDRPVEATQAYGKYFALVVNEVGLNATPTAPAAMTGVTKRDQTGIYVKVPRPVVFEAKLLLAPRELYLYRLKQYDAELTDIAKRLKKARASQDEWKARLAVVADLMKATEAKIHDLQTQLTALPAGADPDPITKAMDAAAKQLEAANTEKGKLEASLKAIGDDEERQGTVTAEIQVNLVLLHQLITTPAEPEVVFQRKAFAMVPSDYAVNIPMENALLGKTNYDLQLAQGVLTSYSMEKPAFLVELVKIPLDITGAVFDQLSQFIQLRINLAGYQKTYAQAQIDLEKTKYELSQLSQKQQADALKAELELRKALVDLETANVTAGINLQNALVTQMSAEQIAKATQEKVLTGLQADISGNQQKIKDNEAKIVELEKKILELTKQIDALHNPPPATEGPAHAPVPAPVGAPVPAPAPARASGTGTLR